MTTIIHKPSLQIARKVLCAVDAGLVKGSGIQEPGKMCVEAAVRFAFGLPHGDDPPCVGSAVRSFKISLNDLAWSSDKARAKGMRKLAIAQLGSDTINQNQFVKELALATIRKIVPLALRAAAHVNQSHKESLETHAKTCETIGDDLNAASDAASDACDAASYASDAARAARAASDVARAASYAASDACDAARAASYAASYAARYAARAARAASDVARAASDEVLTLMADIGLEALIKCKSPGCKWLFLCEPATKKARGK